MTRHTRCLASLMLAAGLLAGAAASAKSLDGLAGRWSTPGRAARAAAGTQMVAAPILGGAWLQLTVSDLHASGREHQETLLLRQSGDGRVHGFLFTAGEDKPVALAGSWSLPESLELAGAGEQSWTWQRESPCRAILIRGPDGRRAGTRIAKTPLALDGCQATVDRGPPTPAAPGRITAEGRSPDAKPGEPVVSEPPRGPIDLPTDERRDLTGGEAERPAAAFEPPPAEASAVGPPADVDPTGVAVPGGEPAVDEPAAPTAPVAAGATEVHVAELPATRAAPTATGTTPQEVLLAGRGKPFDEVKKAVDMLRQWLVEQGVAIQVPSDEIVVLQAADSSLAYLVREARDRNVASLIYVTAAFGGRERIVVECYDPNGLLLWKERIVGGTGMREFQWVNPKLVERMKEKLAPRLGGVGLPRAGDSR